MIEEIKKVILDRGYIGYEETLLSSLECKDKEIEKLKEALQDIADPIGRFRRLLGAEDILNGAMAMRLSDDPNYLKSLAKEALGGNQSIKLKGCLNYLICRKLYSVEQVKQICPKCKDFRISRGNRSGKEESLRESG